jgi:peroxiredoxin Q/BCP
MAAWHPGVLLILGISSLFSLFACSSAKPGSGSVAEDGTERGTGELLPIGSKAPDFTAKDHLGNTIRLSDYAGKQNVVLLFYPMNETPGCTQQLCAARDDFELYNHSDIAVFGVNPADAESHKKFAERYEFPFGIIVDSEGEVTRLFGSRGFAGLVKRTVYVIDKEGKIVFAQRGMPSTAKQLKSLGITKQTAQTQ